MMFLSRCSKCFTIILESGHPAKFSLNTRQKLIGGLFCAKWSTHSSREKDREQTNKMPDKGDVLRYSKLTEKAHDPVRGTEYAAGFDLRSAYDYVVPAHGKELVKTDIQVQIPEGCYGRIAPRSGLAWKNFIDVGAGVIDADYRGNVGVVIFNHGNTDFVIREGDRIAQLICEKITYPSLEEVKTLDNTMRGSGGFGSTGRN